MASRNILNHLGQIIGQLEMPDGTTEEEWSEVLAPYAQAPANPVFAMIEQSIKERKAFADDLMERLKKRNVLADINIGQALWTHSRLRALEVSYPGLPVMTVDLLNMVVSGDVEAACVALMFSVPDDMSQPYHFLSADTIAWIVGELKAYLGWS
ncbi:MAG: hypothetical protein ACK52I_03610 [Pseudomonadota bacterium]|jgi:hypothetical protein